MKKNWFLIKLNNKYFLKAGNKAFRCQIGERGLEKAAKKLEGDKTTPIGKWYLKSLYYRPDKILRPKLKKKNVIKINRITKNCGWCDDIRSLFYNKYIKFSNLQSVYTNYEKLWRNDDAYDIIVVISHNVRPIIKNKGSAIFIHLTKNYKKTVGCVALSKKDFLILLKLIDSKTKIRIF